ncbi:MAG TPA: hypothetical protein V6D00_07470 [Pantanalinema sp.]
MSRRSASLGAIAAFLILASGCASLFGRAPAPGADAARQQVARLAIVEFVDLTGQDVAGSFTRTFCQEAIQSLSGVLAASPIARPGPRLAASWLKGQGATLGVPAFLTGTISGYRVQASQGRVWVSMTVKVVAADTGKILWTKRLVSTEPLDPHHPPAVAFERAARSAAREFAHDYAP